MTAPNDKPSRPPAPLSATSAAAALASVLAAVTHRTASHPIPTVAVLLLGSLILAARSFELLNPKRASLLFFVSSQLACAALSPWERGKAPHGDGPFGPSASFETTHRELIDAPLDGTLSFLASRRRLKALEITLALSFGRCLTSLTIRGRDRPSRDPIGFAVLGVSYALLHGASQSLIGVSHRFYLPMYSMLALALEATTGTPSDEIVALAAGGTFLSAGMAKVVNGGRNWLRGENLCRQMGLGNDVPKRVRWPLPREIDAGNVLCPALAWGAAIFEIGCSIAAISAELVGSGKVRSRTRRIFAIAALGFHFAIATTMFPRYLPQACCYALLFQGGDDRREEDEPTSVSAAAGKGAARFRGGTSRRIPHVLLLVLLSVTFHFRIDSWPLTYVPMYSTAFLDGFGKDMTDVVDRSRVVSESSCISDFSFRDVRVRADGCREYPLKLLRDAAHPKVSKDLLIRGVAKAIVECQLKGGERCTNGETPVEDLDKLARCLVDLCESTTRVEFMALYGDPDEPSVLVPYVHYVDR